MEQLPFYISLVFLITTAITVFLFFRATRKPIVLGIIAAWMLIQWILAKEGFFLKTDSIPPRISFIILPFLVVIIGLFTIRSGRKFIDSIDLKTITILQTIRVPIEIVLLWLFLHRTIPQLMTFEGRNFDILAGITAPLIYYWGFVKKRLSPKLILAWNIAALGTVSFIMYNGVLSAPTPFQKFAFDQPNIAVLYSPYIWLPGIVVPIVFLSHLVSIRQLYLKISREKQSTRQLKMASA